MTEMEQSPAPQAPKKENKSKEIEEGDRNAYIHRSIALTSMKQPRQDPSGKHQEFLLLK